MRRRHHAALIAASLTSRFGRAHRDRRQAARCEGVALPSSLAASDEADAEEHDRTPRSTARYHDDDRRRRQPAWRTGKQALANRRAPSFAAASSAASRRGRRCARRPTLRVRAPLDRWGGGRRARGERRRSSPAPASALLPPARVAARRRGAAERDHRRARSYARPRSAREAASLIAAARRRRRAQGSRSAPVGVSIGPCNGSPRPTPRLNRWPVNASMLRSARASTTYYGKPFGRRIVAGARRRRRRPLQEVAAMFDQPRGDRRDDVMLRSGRRRRGALAAARRLATSPAPAARRPRPEPPAAATSRMRAPLDVVLDVGDRHHETPADAPMARPRWRVGGEVVDTPPARAAPRSDGATLKILRRREKDARTPGASGGRGAGAACLGARRWRFMRRRSSAERRTQYVAEALAVDLPLRSQPRLTDLEVRTTSTASRTRSRTCATTASSRCSSSLAAVSTSRSRGDRAFRVPPTPSSSPLTSVARVHEGRRTARSLPGYGLNIEPHQREGPRQPLRLPRRPAATASPSRGETGSLNACRHSRAWVGLGGCGMRMACQETDKILKRTMHTMYSPPSLLDRQVRRVPLGHRRAERDHREAVAVAAPRAEPQLGPRRRALARR